MARANRVCLRQGCINLVYGRGGLCNEHQRQERLRRDSFNRRPNSRQNYGPQWPKVRREFLQAYPYCVKCGKHGHHVDHIIAVTKGGAILDWSNLETLCLGHHSQKTARIDGGFGNQRR